MGRVLVQTETQNGNAMRGLDAIIPQYAKDKEQLDKIKKTTDEENTAIKTLMKEMDVKQYEAGGYVAKYSVSTRETMNEDKLLNLLIEKGYKESGIIKQRDYVDMDVLEKALYAGEVDEETVKLMDSCKDSKEVVTLRVSVVKPDKED
jgi:tRNA(Phe) wybutosine-synthesizing methylase Tyw3